MGKLLDWDNMPPVGTPVVFKGYRNGFHEHWGFQVGKTYYVGRGIWPRINYGNDFIFELATPFTINAGDYIDSREFSREECERFCELAVECGFGRAYGPDKSYQCIVIDPTYNSINSVSGKWVEELCKNNITTQFREFLDKEKGVSKKAFNNAEFTKADLKDGMRLTDREGDTWWVCETSMVFPPTGAVVALKQWRDNLTFNDNESCDIMLITDRDGTVLFEREEEPRELTIEEIAEAFNLPVELVRIKK